MIPIIGDIIQSVASTITSLFPSDVDKDKAKAILTDAEGKIQAAVLDAQVKLAESHAKELESQASVLRAEMTNKNWLSESWRPILMLTFTVIIGAHYIIFPIVRTFGVVIPNLALSDQLWTLLTIGVNGYIFTSSAEKMIPHISNIITNKKEK